jgi:hypothetical protein
MRKFYRAAAALLMAASMACAQSSASGGKFTNSYGLDVGEIEGRCVFFLTDAGMSAAEVTKKLMRDGYDTARGLEVLLTETTPRKCGELGRKAALKAGFKAVRVRLATDKDRWQRP